MTKEIFIAFNLELVYSFKGLIYGQPGVSF